ncbi:unnamed protein product [Cyclocybe aegerita]|uniref:Uncharacterized protein n=1 Tax=Cyclocybe aegerita TaxID=1973307 RepID=A0A8S0XCR8_CYCAE|nr:unnamed protein product [Cyclocybe aegerita]
MDISTPQKSNDTSTTGFVGEFSISTPTNPPATTTPFRPPTQKPQSTRKPAQSDLDKVGSILDTITNVGWTLPKFLFNLLKLEDEKADGSLIPVKRTKKHKGSLQAMLNGNSKPYLGEILQLLWKNAIATEFRENDMSIEPNGSLFIREGDLNAIEHAQPAMVTWAAELVASLANEESQKMVHPDTGLHLRARAKPGGRDAAHRVTWDAVSLFSLKSLEGIVTRNAPLTKFIFRVESRLAHSVAYRTVYDALAQMAKQTLEDLRSSIQGGAQPT